jgi:hypothetical protein
MQKDMGILLVCFTIDYMASTFHYITYKATVSSYIPKNQSLQFCRMWFFVIHINETEPYTGVLDGNRQ